MQKIKNDYLRQDLVELSVAKFYAFDKASGMEYYSGTLKSHELSASGDSTKVKAGQANDVQYVIPKDKEFALKITDVWSRQDFIAKKFGGDITAVGDSSTVYKMHMPRNYTVEADEEKSLLYIVLKNEPLSGENFIVYNNKTNKAIDTDKVTADGTNKKKYVIAETGLVAGDTVFVTGFKTQASNKDSYSDITSDSKMPELFVCIEIPVFNGSNEVVFYKQFIFPRCQMNSSVTSKGQSEKTEVNDESTINVLKDQTVDYLGRIIYVSPDESVSESV